MIDHNIAKKNHLFDYEEKSTKVADALKSHGEKVITTTA